MLIQPTRATPTAANKAGPAAYNVSNQFAGMTGHIGLVASEFASARHGHLGSVQFLPRLDRPDRIWPVALS